MQTNVEVAKVQTWLTNLVTRFREEYEKLTELEKQQILNSDDYREPCQLEVFWMKEPEFQFLVVTHFVKRNDLEIIINGPYKAHDFLENIEKILEEPRWGEIISLEGLFWYPEESKPTYAVHLANWIGDEINWIKNSIFLKIERPQRGGGMILGSKGGVSEFIGNMSELDCEQIVNGIMKETRRRAREAQEKPKEERPPPPRLQGFGTWFFPPIWIGEIPEPTISDRLQGRYPCPYLKKAFDHPFGKYNLVLNQDGFLAINSEDKETAIRIFNIIMGTSVLLDSPALAVREQEIANVNIDPENLTIVGLGYSSTTLRTMSSDTMLRHYYSSYERRTISEEKLLEILRESERIFENPKKAELLRFLLEAHTHLANSEYSEAFTMSWIILEKHVFDLWNEFLKKQKVNSKRKGKLVNPAVWSTDYLLETLSLSGEMNSEYYRLLSVGVTQLV